MKKLILFTYFLAANLSLVWAGSYVTDPVTNYYTVYIINNTSRNLQLTSPNLGRSFFLNPNRLFEAGTYGSINDIRWSSLPPRQTKAFAVVVKNYKEGYLDIVLDSDGSGFRIMQANKISSPKNCAPTNVLPRFACVYDLSATTANQVVSLIKTTPVYNEANGAPSSGIDFYVSVNPKDSQLDK